MKKLLLVLVLVLPFITCSKKSESYSAKIDSLQSYIASIENNADLVNLEIIAKNELLRTYSLADPSKYASQITELKNYIENKMSEVEFDPMKNPLDAVYGMYQEKPLSSEINTDDILLLEKDLKAESNEFDSKSYTMALEIYSGSAAFPMRDLAETYIANNEIDKAVLTTLFIDSQHAGEYMKWISSLCKISEAYYNNEKREISGKMYEFIELCINLEIEHPTVFVNEKGISAKIKGLAYRSFRSKNINRSITELAISYFKLGFFEKGYSLSEKYVHENKGIASFFSNSVNKSRKDLENTSIRYLLKEDKLAEAESIFEDIEDNFDKGLSGRLIVMYKIEKNILKADNDYIEEAEKLKGVDIAYNTLISEMLKAGKVDLGLKLSGIFNSENVSDELITAEVMDSLQKKFSFYKLSKAGDMRMKRVVNDMLRVFLAEFLASHKLENELNYFIAIQNDTYNKLFILNHAVEGCIKAEMTEEAQVYIEKIEEMIDRIPNNSSGSELLAEIACKYYSLGETAKAESHLEKAWSVIAKEDSYTLNNVKEKIIGNLAEAGFYSKLNELYEKMNFDVDQFTTKKITILMLDIGKTSEALQFLEKAYDIQTSALIRLIARMNEKDESFTNEELLEINKITRKWKKDYASFN